MSQYKKRRHKFPFTPHTTLRPDYCSGGSFFTAFTAGAALKIVDATQKRIQASGNLGGEIRILDQSLSSQIHGAASKSQI